MIVTIITATMMMITKKTTNMMTRMIMMGMIVSVRDDG